MANAIAAHPNRQVIIDAILAGKTDTEVAKLAGVSRPTVSRFRRTNLNATVQQTMQAAKALQDTGLLANAGNEDAVQQAALQIARTLDARSVLLSRIEQREAQLTQMLTHAADKHDYRGYSNLIASDCKRIELQAKLAGVLQDGGHAGAGALNIVVMMPEGRDRQPGECIDVQAEPA